MWPTADLRCPGCFNGTLRRASRGNAIPRNPRTPGNSLIGKPCHERAKPEPCGLGKPRNHVCRMSPAPLAEPHIEQGDCARHDHNIPKDYPMTGHPTHHSDTRNEGAERILIVSDIHSNIEALEACLADARARGGFTRCWNIGDTVGYGPDPVAVLDGLNRTEVPAITTRSKAEFA